MQNSTIFTYKYGGIKHINLQNTQTRRPKRPKVSWTDSSLQELAKQHQPHVERVASYVQNSTHLQSYIIKQQVQADDIQLVPI